MNKLNVRLLRRIQEHISAKPSRFFMSWFIARGKPGTRPTIPFRWVTGSDLPARTPDCGTVACIAGWANILTGAKTDRSIASASRAQKALGLSFHQREGLFNSYFWPRPFIENYSNAKTPAQRVKVAVKRIEHLINTGE